MEDPDKQLIDALIVSATSSMKASNIRQIDGVLSATSDYSVRITGPFCANDLRSIAAALEVAAKCLGDAVIGLDYKSHEEAVKNLQDLVHETLAKKEA